MWIKTTVLLSLVLATLAANNTKKDDGRGKRNLQYNIAHHYSPPPTYKLERRISTGPQIPSLYHSQYFPGPRSYSPYHKGRPHHSLPPPPYAVQMEPLVHYSQRDPLYDTNSLSLNADGQDDLLTDNNHISENSYGPPKHIVERPIYIKEPEPIIEIIIKESNVTLPPPPAPPTPPPKKKEQVQVFYVKYKKNPNGHGKDSIIYDKPVPAISPPIEDEHEEPPPVQHHQEVVTAPPPPSTTLRTIIRPESETYHSPSGVKVTFGKEGFDYDKRSSKADDQKASNDENRSVQFPQGRQLSTFPRRPSNHNFNFSNFRQPQPYRPFGLFRQQQPSQSYPRPTQQEYSTLPKFAQFSQPPKSSQHFPPPRPVPPQFQRQPVPYQPFESLRQQPTVPFRPETHFPITQAPPVAQKPVGFNQFVQQRPNFEARPQVKPQYQQKPQQHFQQRPQVTHHQQTISQHQFPQLIQHQVPIQHQQQVPISHQQQLPLQHQPQFQIQHQQQIPIQHQQFQSQLPVIPPEGQLIQSIPKYEQHVSVSEALKSSPQPLFQSIQNQPQYHPQPQIQQSSIQYTPTEKPSKPQTQDKIQQQLHEANAFQETIRQSSPDFFNYQQQYNFYQTSPKPSTTTSTTTTTTTPKPSTTTKDPKVLNAQLPDEVPDDLREQLLSSGILNHADISVLDYDKVGDIPLSALPPDQLANFYSAGGAQQIQAAGSEQVASISNRDFTPEASEIHEVKVKPEVQMKVVRYNPEKEEGQQVQEAYVKEDATQVEPVALNDEKYNRYLPLKISGAQFPIPDVPELKGKKITSVVVLAPVSYDFSSSRQTRQTKEDIELLEDHFLKTLINNPTKENFKKFLEMENKTNSEQQAVILLVAGPSEGTKDKEIFMYDLSTKTVSKLDGELSSAFVEAAEANSNESKTTADNIVEKKIPVTEDLETVTLKKLDKTGKLP